MDIQFRNLLRDYASAPTDELAHKLASMFLRTHGSQDLMEQFYEAYWWLHEHPMLTYKGSIKPRRSAFPDCLDIHLAKIDPQTRRIEDDKTRNTHVEIWIEVLIYCDPANLSGSGPTLPDNELTEQYRQLGIPTHFWELDCGGDTFEEAIITLAKDMNEKYPHPDYNPFPASLQP